MLAKNGTLELKFKAERYLECCCLSSVMRKANFMRTDDALADHQKRLEDQYLPTSYLWIHRRFLKFNGDAFESKPAGDPYKNQGFFEEFGTFLIQELLW